MSGRDITVRAAHTLWQSFTAAFVAAYVASGLDISQIVDVSSAKKFALACGTAAGAALLSAVKSTVRQLLDARAVAPSDAAPSGYVYVPENQ